MTLSVRHNHSYPIILCFSSLPSWPSAGPHPSSVWTLEQGACFQGQWAYSNRGNRYASFQRIRYAQPPLGDLRFKQPYNAGEGVWDVSGKSEVVCPQLKDDGLTFMIVRDKMSPFTSHYHVWQPVPDTQYTPDPFLPGDAEQLMESGQFNTEIELILGKYPC